MLHLISIAQPEFIQVESQRHRQRQSILPNLSPANRLHADVQVIWRNRPVLPDFPREPGADAFIDRTIDIAPKAQRPENIEIKTLRKRHRDLNVRPLLIVRSIDRLRRRA